MNGHWCDNCDHKLREEDYDDHKSWSYTCPSCGFRYRHSYLTASEQIEEFNNEEQDKEQDEEQDEE